MLDFSAEPEVQSALLEHFQTTDLDAVRCALGVDTRTIAPEYIGPALKTCSGGSQMDIWGIMRRPVPNECGTYMEPVTQPWATMTGVDEVNAYPWPQVEWYDFSAFADKCTRYSDYAIIFGRPGLMDLINGVAFGRGVEQVLLDIAARDEAGLALFEKRFEFSYGFAKAGLEAAGGAVDILLIGEDLGTQQGLVISPDSWREVFAPYLRKMIDLGHHYGARVMMHSCGSISALIEDFIEMGLDAVQAVQPNADGMSPEYLSRRYGGRMVFDGTMDIQETLPRGSTEQVRNQVRERATAFRNCGGLILGPCHQIQPDTPLVNILAMYEAGRERMP